MSETQGLQPGTQLDGRYEIVRLLGQGGMAAVYEVRHLGLHSTHALKVLNPDLARNDELRGRFLSEGRIQARLRHPNIVQVTEIVTTPVAGLVMDYVDGPTLAGFCEQKGPLDVPTVLEVFLPVLDAVDEAHKAHVVHRDLKPDNIMLGRDSRGRLMPMVTDFGIAKMLLEESASKKKTRAGARMGTLLYMSPEQIRGAEEVDARSDIFALGAILYEAVTGRLAFDGPSEYETMQSIVQGTYEPPERIVGGLPPVIAGCIRKALAVDPAERFQDCAAFRAALETALDAEPQVPEKPSRSFAVTKVQPPSEQVVEAAPAPVSRPAPKPAPAPVSKPAPVPPPARVAAPVPQPRPAPAPPRPKPAAPVPPVATEPRPLTPSLNRAAGPVPNDMAIVKAREMLEKRKGKKGSIAPNPHTSPALATVLSLMCLPGMGQFYNAQFLKGMLALIVTGVAVSTTDLGILALPVLNILFAVDAHAIAKKRQDGEPVGTLEFF
jgi:serine/threonine-protein kinase